MEITAENCKKFEFFETPSWVVERILDEELLESFLKLDPCCGLGAITNPLKERYDNVIATDINNWGYGNKIVDFLSQEFSDHEKETPTDIIMNPPFSKACEFLLKAKELNYGKILVFQRFAWLESSVRREFWEKHAPSRVYVCGSRATCWRGDIKNRASSTPTTHAWFVWDSNCKETNKLKFLYKD